MSGEYFTDIPDAEDKTAVTTDDKIDFDRLYESMCDDIIAISAEGMKNGREWANDVATYGELAKQTEFRLAGAELELDAMPRDEVDLFFGYLRHQGLSTDDADYRNAYVTHWYIGASEVYDSFRRRLEAKRAEVKP